MKKFGLSFYALAPALMLLGGSSVLSLLTAIKWINIVIFAVVCTVIQIAVYKKNPANFIINTLWLGFMVEFMLIALVVPENLGIREVIDNVILCLNASYVFLILFPILFSRRFRPIFPSLLARTKV
ncbi:MAG: hypothetical protein ACLSA1_03615 [Alphaproteobacteria bacterium]